MKYDKRKYYFDKQAADRPIKFLENFVRHVDGDLAGEPFVLDNWQKDIWRQVFGWKHKKNGNRKHRMVWIELPKGNGKSMMLSGISLYMSCADEFRPTRAECYAVAGDREQARIVHNGAKAMIEGSPKLTPAFNVWKNSIEHIKSHSFIKVLSADAFTKHGYRPWLIAFDEIHVQKSRELYDTLVRGMIKLANSMCVIITTAGVKNTFPEELHDYARKIKEGIIDDPAWYVVIYSAPTDADPFIEKTWKIANPGYGTIIKPDNFKMMVKEAQNNPSAINGFRRLHLNEWTGSTEAWIPVHVFDKCDLGPEEEEELKNLPCYGGLDVAHTSDLTSFSLVFEKNDGTLVWKCWFWCPEDTVLERDRLENVNYSSWVRSGYVFATPGNVQDHQMIEDFIVDRCTEYEVQGISFDKARAKVMAANIYGRADVEMNGLPQTVMGLTPGAQEMEKRIMSQTINHEGNPVLRWQMDNVELYRDTNENIRPHKGKSRGRIDGIMSGIMALAEYLTHKAEDTGPSKYEDEEFTIV